MNRLLAPSFIVCVLSISTGGTQRSLAQPDAGGIEAEKIFRKMEKTITGAKTISVRRETAASVNGFKSSIKTNVLFDEGNKIFYEIERTSDDKPHKVLIIGNGDKVFVDVNGTGSTQDSQKKLGEACRNLLAYYGSAYDLHLPLLIRALEKGPSPKSDDKTKLSDFKLGATEKVANAQTRIIEFVIREPGADGKTVETKVKAWVNSQTHLPAKWDIRTEQNGSTMAVTDTFLEFVVDGKVEAKRFELPR